MCLCSAISVQNTLQLTGLAARKIGSAANVLVAQYRLRGLACFDGSELFWCLEGDPHNVRHVV